MKKNVYYFLMLCFVTCIVSADCFGQVKSFNLNFEERVDGHTARWMDLNIDSTQFKSGKYSSSITSSPGVEFKSIALGIPDSYEGKEITLTGYIKTENVTGGYAGLWMRMDPMVAFDNMSNRGLTGTNGWTKCEVKLTLNPAITKQIVIGALLVGNGKMWVDDLTLSIDGKDIQTLELINKKKNNE